MTSQRFVGARYGEAAPGGQFAVALWYGGRIETDSGPIPDPRENILFLRAQWRDGARWLTGAGHQTDKAWLWNGVNWTEHGIAHGVNPCAFEPTTLLVCQPNNVCLRLPLAGGPATPFPLASGSQGIRWVRPDGVIVTADESYADPARGLFQFTDYGDVAFGEADDSVGGGVVRFADDGVLRRIEPGRVRFVRVQRDGATFAVAMNRQDTDEVVLVWATEAELRALPPAVQAPVLPVVPAALAGRMLWLGYFKCISDRYGDNPAAPGNCTFIETAAEAARSPWPYFAPIGVGDGSRKIASILSIARGQEPPTDVPSHTMVLYDGGAVLPPQPCGAWTGLECYSDPGEAFETVEARLRAWLTAWPTAAVTLIGQAYTRNGTEYNQQKLADLQGLPLRLAVEFPQINGVLWFSDGRPTGTRDNEWWRPVHREAAALVRSPWSMSQHLDTVTEERAKYPAPQYGASGQLLNPLGNQTAGHISNAVVWRHRSEGWGLLAKPAGQNWIGLGQPYSMDVIINVREKQIVDCLGSAEAEGKPQWNVLDWVDVYAERWRAPIDPALLEPTPPPDDLEARVAQLEADMTRVLTAMRSV